MTWNIEGTVTPADLAALRTWFEDTVMAGTTGFTKQNTDGAGFNSGDTWWEVEIDAFNRAAPITQYFGLNWSSSKVAYGFDTDGNFRAAGINLLSADHYRSATLPMAVEYVWWTSTENSGALLVTRGPDTTFYWPGFRSGHNKIHAYGVNGESDRKTVVGMWISHDGFGNHWCLKGRPLDLVKNNDSSPNDPIGPLAVPFFDDPGSGSFGLDPLNKSVLYSNSWFGAGTNNEATVNPDPDTTTSYQGYQANVVNINQPDVYHWVPAGISNWHVGGYDTDNGTVTFDGTNYYWATYSNSAYQGIWFDMGTTNQLL